nr:MAG TPA: hypothetical protein [Bacteriophage sp.]
MRLLSLLIFVFLLLVTRDFRLNFALIVPAR